MILGGGGEYDSQEDQVRITEFDGLVVAHAAVYGGMMVNFGRHFAERLVEMGADLHFFVSRLQVFGRKPPVADLEAIGGKFHGLPLRGGLTRCARFGHWHCLR